MRDQRNPGDPIPGEVVREYRVRNGLTQDELAKKLGLAGKAVISAWETGRSQCEGPAAEFLLHLFGRGNAAIEVPALTRSMNEVWERTGNFITSWRQVVAIPEGRVELNTESFVTLFPEASLPLDEVEHGFPFTGQDLPGNVCGLTSAGWLGCIPAHSDQQPHYLWKLTRDGQFAYREALWEDDPRSVTQGHFDAGTLAMLSLQTAFFLKRVMQKLKQPTDLGFTLQLDLRGAKGKGVVDASRTVAAPRYRHTQTWAEDAVEATVRTNVGQLHEEPEEVGFNLARELCMQVNVELAGPQILRRIISSKIEGSKSLGFLRGKAS